MDTLSQLNELNHHAYCLVGIAPLDLYRQLEEVNKIATKANPDFFHEKYEVFSIDESRRIKEIHSSKAFASDSKRIFIIECKGMTNEAQNALLKIFEEPNENAYFFLIIPSVSLLLPTLRSRLSIIETEKEDQPGLAEAKKFLALSAKDKITFVDDIAKRISDEVVEKSEAIEFLAALEALLYTKGVEKNMKAIKAVLKAKDYMNDRSASTKQLLQYVALSF